MTSTSTPATFAAAPSELAVLREVIEEHAAFSRPAGSAGEALSAELLRERLRDAGADARIEPATFYQGWPSALALAVAVPLVAGLVGPKRGRKTIAAACVAAGALFADDIDNRTRLLRRALRRKRPTTNVVAELGSPDAPVTLVVLAHHDAGRTGQMFDQSLQKLIYRHFPKRIESMNTAIPYWWPAFIAPVAVGAGLVTDRRGLQLGGAAICSIAFGLLVDIHRSPTVPGANDNLSGVAVLVALAERWRREPVPGVRVVLVSAGAEEELQGGVYGYLRDHGAELDPTSTWCLTVDTVGSRQLVMLEGEGTVAMHDYTDPSFRDLTEQVAAERGVSLHRGMRSRFSTDAIVFSRANIPTVSIVSLEPWKAPANYHLMTDTPENVVYETVAATVELAEGLAVSLGQRARG